jgi:hypothetical protein
MWIRIRVRLLDRFFSGKNEHVRKLTLYAGGVWLIARDNG